MDTKEGIPYHFVKRETTNEKGETSLLSRFTIHYSRFTTSPLPKNRCGLALLTSGADRIREGFISPRLLP